MNNFNKASRYTYLLLFVELAILASVYLVINYFANNWDAGLPLLLIFIIEMAGNMLYLFAIIRLYKLFRKDFLKTIVSLAVLISISIVVFVFEKQLENNSSLMLVVVLITTVARMLCYYFMLGSFHDICADMGNVYLAKLVQVCRTLYMVGIILNAATNNNFAGEQLSYIFSLVYQVVSLYILFIYSRLGRALKDYKEPEDGKAEQTGIE